MKESALIDILAEDGEVILYRKSLRPITGSVTATILLQQIIWHDKRKQRESFYKFKAPCSHKLYKDGDSWTEELGFSNKEFDSALSKIGTKITQGMSKDDVLNSEELNPNFLVIFWTDASRVTWYTLNRDLLGKLLKGIYLVGDERAFTRNVTKGLLPITETPTETPTYTSLSDDKDTPTEQPTQNYVSPKADEPKTPRKARQPQKNGYANDVAPEADKDNTPHQVMFEAICICTGWDYKIITKEQQGQVAQTLGKLEKAGYAIEDLRAFYRNWKYSDWRGKQGQSPTLTQIRAEIGKVKQDDSALLNGYSTATNGNGASMSRRVQVL